MELNNFLARNPHLGGVIYENKDIGEPGRAVWEVKAMSESLLTFCISHAWSDDQYQLGG